MSADQNKAYSFLIHILLSMLNLNVSKNNDKVFITLNLQILTLQILHCNIKFWANSRSPEALKKNSN